MDGTVRLFLLVHVLTFSLTTTMPAAMTDERQLDVSTRVDTRVGCRVSLKCAGVGNTVKWEKLESFNSSIKKNSHTTNTTQSFPRYISNDVEFEFFEYIDVKNPKHGVLECKITEGQTIRRSRQSNVVLSVSPEIVAVSTAPSINISQYYSGKTINISCLVETCMENVTVSLYKGNQQIEKLTSLGRDTEKTVYDFYVTVDEHSADSYACAVDAWGDMGTHSAVHKFEVVGTPKNRPMSRRR